MRLLLIFTALCFTALALGCSSNSAPPPSTKPGEKLPPEVSGSPEDALPKKR
jgi:hypothetical protein